ncbi:MAG: kinase/pyrophosphorylase [Betaproteobacteria bacterium]|jgi:[pyruvate, water dikinase]-phosphate phosphotransferase / [pyruvate, water dikinase] kinase|nr:MAG: kinase/pyrophosphorylase [Betaproteobacteria bacterium]
MPNRRAVFYVSDRTGITAEALGNSLLTQFDAFEFKKTTIPFVDSMEAADRTVAHINATAASEQHRPIVISSIVDEAISARIRECNARVLDFFQVFIAPLEQELGVKSAHAAGRSHGLRNSQEYFSRIEAINFTLAHDDGQSTKELGRAQVILVGVSRCGKTPTSLYLGLQCGIRCANFPLTPDDFERGALPDSLLPYRDKLFGLTIASDRLQAIRQERRPDSTYSSAEQCRREVQAAERLMEDANVPMLNTSTKSIEELATTILMQRGLDRHIF